MHSVFFHNQGIMPPEEAYSERGVEIESAHDLLPFAGKLVQLSFGSRHQMAYIAKKWLYGYEDEKSGWELYFINKKKYIPRREILNHSTLLDEFWQLSVRELDVEECTKLQEGYDHGRYYTMTALDETGQDELDGVMSDLFSANFGTS